MIHSGCFALLLAAASASTCSHLIIAAETDKVAKNGFKGSPGRSDALKFLKA